MEIKEFFKRKGNKEIKIDNYKLTLDEYKKDEFIPAEKLLAEELKVIINKIMEKYGNDKFELLYTIRKKNSIDIKILSAEDTREFLETNISEIDKYIWTILLKKKY